MRRGCGVEILFVKLLMLTIEVRTHVNERTGHVYAEICRRKM